MSDQVWAATEDSAATPVSEGRIGRPPRSDPPTQASLWELYEAAGFLYDGKRRAMEPHLDAIRETLGRLLTPDCTVNQFFLRRQNGRLENALNVTWYYPKTWLIHHMVSRQNPVGMMAILVDGMCWIMDDPSIDFGSFYWRPDNRRSDQIFQRMSSLLTAERPGAHEITTYDYYVLPLAGLASRLEPDPACVTTQALEHEYNDLARALRGNLTDIQFRSRGLEADQLTLRSLDRTYRARGLFRTRDVFVTRRDGEIVAVGLAERSSPGLNFSHYFDKFQVHPLDQGLDETGRLGWVHSLLLAICRHYLANGRTYAATLCEPGRLPEYAALGFSPQKQYCNMTISRVLEKGVCVAAVEGYYQERLQRLQQRSRSSAPAPAAGGIDRRRQ